MKDLALHVAVSLSASVYLHAEKSLFSDMLMTASDGSGLKPGPGPALSPGFLESPRPDFGRRAQARARPGPLVKSPGAQRALGILTFL